MNSTPNLNIPIPDPTVIPPANVDEEFLRLRQAWLLVDGVISALQTTVAGKAASNHTHPMSGIAGLITALAAKMDANKTFKLVDLVDILGATDASTGYLLQKTVNGFSFASAASLLGNHQHGTNDIVGLVSLIQQHIAALVNTALGNDPNFATSMMTALAARYTKTEVDGLLAGIDAWAMQPVGSYVFFDDGTAGLQLPPLNKAYRYLDLTAGLSGAGGYNEGVLTGETVTGSAPSILATATVALAGSPFNTQTVRLLNTERRFLRPGSAGTLEDSQNKSHTHSGTAASAGSHTHTIPMSGEGSSNNNVGAGNANTQVQGTTGSSGAHTHTLTIDSNGGLEARPRSVGVRVFRRIK